MLTYQKENIKMKINYYILIFLLYINPLFASKIELTQVEQEYLNNNTITYAGDPNWLPYEAFDKNGNYTGIIAEHIEILEKKLNKKFDKIITKHWLDTLELSKNRDVDIISGDAADVILSKNYKAIDTYIKNPLVIVTRKEYRYIDDLNSIKDKKIAFGAGGGYSADILKKYPNIKFIECDTPLSGLLGVKTGKYDAFIGTLAMSDYTIMQMGIEDIKIAGQIGIVMSLTLFVDNKKPILYSIINKSIKTISKAKQHEIISKWRNSTVKNVIDYTLVWQISIVFFIVTIISLFFIFLLKQSNKKLKQSQKENMHLNSELTQLNKTLETRVKEQIKELDRRHKFMAQQSRLASMGEMLSSIAHQWRQPLNRINSNVSVLKSVVRRDMIEPEILTEQTEQIEQNTKYMSDTIEDFANFFHPDKIETKFSLQTAIKKALELISQRTNNVKFKINSTKNIELFSFEKEYIQVLLIILNNAIDNFTLQEIKEPKIDIIIKEQDDNVILYISDNGGGIDKRAIEYIFDPYYTTKFAKEGTGLGLYMAKMIIENSMLGELLVSNQNAGACFEIITPLGEKNV